MSVIHTGVHLLLWDFTWSCKSVPDLARIQLTWHRRALALKYTLSRAINSFYHRFCCCVIRIIFVSIYQISGDRFEEGVDDIDMFWDFARTIDKISHPINVAILSTIPSLQYMPGRWGALCREMTKTKEVILNKFYYSMKVRLCFIKGSKHDVSSYMMQNRSQYLNSDILLS